MNKKIMKLIVIPSMIIALLWMKLKLSMYTKRHRIKNRYQKMILRLNRLASTSISKIAEETKDE